MVSINVSSDVGEKWIHFLCSHLVQFLYLNVQCRKTPLKLQQCFLSTLLTDVLLLSPYISFYHHQHFSHTQIQSSSVGFWVLRSGACSPPSPQLLFPAVLLRCQEEHLYSPAGSHVNHTRGVPRKSVLVLAMRETLRCSSIKQHGTATKLKTNTILLGMVL